MQHAIITGGSSGIGFALASKLYSRGWALSLIARDRSRLELAKQALHKLCKNSTQEINLYAVDVSIETDSIEVAHQCVTALGHPELLITCAGIVTPGYFEDSSTEAHRLSMEINYFGTLYLVKTISPYMVAAGNGHIVMLSSGAGLMGVFGYTTYSPSKFALRGLAESLRGELKRHGVRVSIVFPPDTDTPQLREEVKSKPVEAYAITGKARTWSAEAVADCILSGIQKNRLNICPGLEMTMLHQFNSLVSPILNKIMDNYNSKMDRK